MNTLKEEMIKRVEELNEKLEEKEFHLEVKKHLKIMVTSLELQFCPIIINTKCVQQFIRSVWKIFGMTMTK